MDFYESKSDAVFIDQVAVELILHTNHYASDLDCERIDLDFAWWRDNWVFSIEPHYLYVSLHQEYCLWDDLIF